MPNERFPGWLARKMNAERWSQVDLAERIGTSSSVVSRWVRGERVPSSKSAERIADVFHVSPDYVLSLTGHRPDGIDDEDDELREELIAMIEAHPLPITEGLVATVRSVLELHAGPRARK